jgi:hypothetical protein
MHQDALMTTKTKPAKAGKTSSSVDKALERHFSDAIRRCLEDLKASDVPLAKAQQAVATSLADACVAFSFATSPADPMGAIERVKSDIDWLGGKLKRHVGDGPLSRPYDPIGDLKKKIDTLKTKQGIPVDLPAGDAKNALPLKRGGKRSSTKIAGAGSAADQSVLIVGDGKGNIVVVDPDNGGKAEISVVAGKRKRGRPSDIGRLREAVEALARPSRGRPTNADLDLRKTHKATAAECYARLQARGEQIDSDLATALRRLKIVAGNKR